MDRSEIASFMVAEIPRLRRFARFLTRDVVRADDIVQESLFRALKRVDSWEQGTNLRAWLLTILRNTYLTELRYTRRAPAMVEYDEIQHAASHVGTQGFAGELASVQRAFRQLAEEQRQILLLCGVEELTYKEAALILDLPIGTVRSRLSRARTTMRQLLPDMPSFVQQRS